MPLLKRRTSRDVEIPSSSMADIAFLLLIFFLLVTTINTEKGISMQLPPKLDETVEPPEIKQRNLLNILVNNNGDVLADGEFTRISEIRGLIKRHVMNNGADPDLSENPQNAVTSFKTERALPYETYIEVLDEIKAAYSEVRDEYARSISGTDYANYRARLGEEDVDEVKEAIPLKISLAEPDQG